MSKLSKEQFEAYLEQIKNLAEGPFEEMQRWKPVLAAAGETLD